MRATFVVFRKTVVGVPEDYIYSHVDDHTRQTTDTPGFKPFDQHQLKSSVEKRPKWRFWKISSFVRVIGFCFIPNIHKIDNKVEEEETKKIGPIQERFKKKFFWSDSNPQSRERERERQTETETERERERERQREREREYPTEPKSRVRADIAGGLRGCESRKKPPVRRA